MDSPDTHRIIKYKEQAWTCSAQWLLTYVVPWYLVGWLFWCNRKECIRKLLNCKINGLSMRLTDAGFCAHGFVQAMNRLISSRITPKPARQATNDKAAFLSFSKRCSYVLKNTLFSRLPPSHPMCIAVGVIGLVYSSRICLRMLLCGGWVLALYLRTLYISKHWDGGKKYLSGSSSSNTAEVCCYYEKERINYSYR